MKIRHWPGSAHGEDGLLAHFYLSVPNFSVCSVIGCFPSPVLRIRLLQTSMVGIRSLAFPRHRARRFLKFSHDTTLFAPGDARNLERTAETRNLAADRIARQRSAGAGRPGSQTRFAADESAGPVQPGP